MIHSGRFIALLDANVIYPAPLRDYLLRLAQLELYKPKWTDRIHEEWMRNLLLKRTDLTKPALERTIQAMNSAFPDATIGHYEDLIAAITGLPDPDDAHVMAAAIKANADVIVTANIKDFPPSGVKKYDLEAQHPDDFVANLIALDKAKCELALKNLIGSLKNPPMTKDEVLDTLKQCGLEASAEMLRK